jgi:hypothetical protein
MHYLSIIIYPREGYRESWRNGRKLP